MTRSIRPSKGGKPLTDHQTDSFKTLIVIAFMQVSISTKTIPLGTNPWTLLEGSKTLPWDNHCVQKPSPRDKKGSPNLLGHKVNKFHNASIK